ncbi:MAG: flagellar hook-associated protein FlgK, partial [Rhodocyclaceae bacterium]
PNPTGVSDNRNALLLGSLQTRNTMSGGTATYQSSYSQIVSQIGNKAREVEVASKAQETLVKQGQDFIQSSSGVNLDEEAANLIRYQQAYQASAKMIDVASKLFEEVLALGK